jgi:hypothetical protein
MGFLLSCFLWAVVVAATILSHDVQNLRANPLLVQAALPEGDIGHCSANKSTIFRFKLAGFLLPIWYKRSQPLYRMFTPLSQPFHCKFLDVVGHKEKSRNSPKKVHRHIAAS